MPTRIPAVLIESTKELLLVDCTLVNSYPTITWPVYTSHIHFPCHQYTIQVPKGRVPLTPILRKSGVRFLRPSHPGG